MPPSTFAPRLRALLICASLIACTQHMNPPALAGQDVRLTVLHTSDIHSRLLPYSMVPNIFDKQDGLGLLDPTGAAAASGSSVVVGGAARMMTILRRERTRAQRVIHLDSGDCYQGAPIFNLYAGEAEMRAMTAFGVDAAALGNHEFDKGIDNLASQISRWAAYPVLAANYIFPDWVDPQQSQLGRWVQPFTILNVDGLKVGVIGLGNFDSLVSIVEGGNNLGIQPVDPQQVMEYYSALLRPQVDLLVAVSHLGLSEDETSALSARAQLQDPNNAVAAGDTDVIFGGHLHIVLNPPKEIQQRPDYDRKTLLVHSGAFAKFVGRLDLVVHVNTADEIQADLAEQRKLLCGPTVTKDNCDRAVHIHRGRMVGNDYQLFPVDDKVPEDGEMARILEPYTTNLNEQYDLTRVFAFAATGSGNRISRVDPNGGDSPLGNLVATAMRLRRGVEADFALTNSLGIRTDIDPGPITLEEMYNVFPFENTITVMYLSGSEITEMMDFVSKKSSERGCRTQVQVSGMRFEMDCDHTCGQLPATDEDHRGDNDPRQGCARQIRIESPCDCVLNGTCPAPTADNPKPKVCERRLNPFGSYRVAVNDYIANGGSGFLVLKRNTTKVNTGISLRDALIDYFNHMDDPAFEGSAAIRCNDAFFKTNASLVSVAPDIAARYCPNAVNPDAAACFGSILCVRDSNQAHDGRISPLF